MEQQHRKSLLQSGALILRPVRETDKHYILATWSKGILPLPPFKWMTSNVWNRHHDRMEVLVSSDTVLVACNPNDIDHIIGYVVANIPAGFIHWLYVKKRFRNNGIGTDLLEAVLPKGIKSGFVFTHMSKELPSAVSEHGVYDPYMAWT